MAFAEPTEDEKGRGAYEPYVSPPLRLAAAWSWRAIVIVVALGGLFWLLAKVSQVILPALIALLLAALLSPVHSFLVRVGWPRALSAATVFIGFLVLVLGAITLVGQQIIVGFGNLWTQVVAGFETISEWLNSNPFGLDSSIISEYIDEGVSQGVAYLEQNASNLVGGAAGAVSSVGTFLTGLLLALFSAFFFLYDGRRMFTWSLRLMPKPARAKTEGAVLRGWQTLVQYVRVQIIVAGVDAIGIGIGAIVLGIPLAIPLTVLVFLGSFIPIVGAVVTGAIAVLVALVSQGFGSAIIMLIVVLAVQQIESNVLQPFIMGKAVSIHPLAVILVVAAGAFQFGIVGALFAVPLIAVLNTVVRFLAGEDVFAESGEEDVDDVPTDDEESPQPAAVRAAAGARASAGGDDPATGDPDAPGRTANGGAPTRSAANGPEGPRTPPSPRSTFGADQADADSPWPTEESPGRADDDTDGGDGPRTL